MREIEVRMWCDGPTHLEHVPAEVERVITVGDGKPVLLDLCRQCDGDVMSIVQAGTPLDKAMLTAEEEENRCPDCGFLSASRAALGQHLRARHQKGLKDL